MKSVNHIVVYHLEMETKKKCLYKGSSELIKKRLRSNPKKGRNFTRLELRGDLYVPVKVGSGCIGVPRYGIKFPSTADKNWNAKKAKLRN